MSKYGCSIIVTQYTLYLRIGLYAECYMQERTYALSILPAPKLTHCGPSVVLGDHPELIYPDQRMHSWQSVPSS
jgi:hypothetical protein